MTEADWLNCRTPREMFPALQESVTERKARLYACGCVRVLWDRLPDERSRLAVAAAETFADGGISAGELADAYRAALTAYHERSRLHAEDSPFALAAAETARPTFRAGGRVDLTLTLGQAIAVYAANVKGNPPVELLHELFGNPFQPLSLEPNWLVEDAAGLALEIHLTRSWDQMPRLAKLLADAGCDQPELLAHLRQRGFHARGCWALDAVLSVD